MMTWGKGERIPNGKRAQNTRRTEKVLLELEERDAGGGR